MPSTPREIPARLLYPDRDPRPAVAHVLHHDRPARVRRAVRVWLGAWALGVAAVFLPVLHFVLVPALVLAGPLLGVARLRERASLVRVAGDCPACGRSLDLALRHTLAEHIALRCEGCGRQLDLATDPAQVAAIGAA